MSFFIIIIYESITGLDQTSYFNFVITILAIQHFGYLNKIFDLNNPTVNFIILKIVNFIFTDSWFMQKFSKFTLYGYSDLVFKILINLDEKIKEIPLILYFQFFTLYFYSHQLLQKI